MTPRLWVDGIINSKACTGRFIGESEGGQVWEVMSSAWGWRRWGTGPIQGSLALPLLLIASRWELGSWAIDFPIFQARHWDFFKLKLVSSSTVGIQSPEHILHMDWPQLGRGGGFTSKREAAFALPHCLLSLPSQKWQQGSPEDTGTTFKT